MYLDDAELERLLQDTESDRVERKESWRGSAPEKGREAICAFANDLPDHGKPGVLFVGADDAGVPTGLAIDDQLLLTLSDMKTDGKVVPTPTLFVHKRNLFGADVAVVTVLPADAPPVRYDGSIFIRIGPRRGKATTQDERILNEKRRFRDIPFDVQPVPSSDLGALDRGLFENEYLPGAVSPEILELNGRTYEERLCSCRMIHSTEEPVPTILGLLVLGIQPRDWLPGAYVQFLRIQGTLLTDPIVDAATLDGPLGQLLRRVDERLDAHLRVAVDIASASVERRISEYPRVAVQQVCRNAIMHRNYEQTNSPVRIHVFDDRIEVISPGGPFGAVTCENFGMPGITDYRNPHIAEAMRVLGYVQRFGVGIALAQDALSKAGHPPLEFECNSAAVMAVIRRKS